MKEALELALEKIRAGQYHVSGLKSSIVSDHSKVISKYGGIFVGDFALRTAHGWSERPYAVYWQENPPNGYSNYYAIGRDSIREGIITTGASAAMGYYDGVFILQTEEVLISRWVHDFHTDETGNFSIDGGRDYTRCVGNLPEPSVWVRLALRGPELKIVGVLDQELDLYLPPENTEQFLQDFRNYTGLWQEQVLAEEGMLTAFGAAQKLEISLEALQTLQDNIEIVVLPSVDGYRYPNVQFTQVWRGYKNTDSALYQLGQSPYRYELKPGIKELLVACELNPWAAYVVLKSDRRRHARLLEYVAEYLDEVIEEPVESNSEL